MQYILLYIIDSDSRTSVIIHDNNSILFSFICQFWVITKSLLSHDFTQVPQIWFCLSSVVQEEFCVQVLVVVCQIMKFYIIFLVFIIFLFQCLVYHCWVFYVFKYCILQAFLKLFSSVWIIAQRVKFFSSSHTILVQISLCHDVQATSTVWCHSLLHKVCW